MDLICELNKCTGCGMCSNICPKQAIKMEEGKNGFIFPYIDNDLCIDCGICKSKCPSNTFKNKGTNVIKTYAGWNKNAAERKKSTSGGIFTVLAKKVIDDGGVVVGVAWDDSFTPRHVLIDTINGLERLQGSKYSQSNTGTIYRQVKDALNCGKKVLFSGTPCQNAALRMYLGKDYFNLLTIDLVCHGVPSNRMLLDYFNHFNKRIVNVRLRYKDPYWDYCYVRIDFDEGKPYQELTINDDYFNLFNIGFSLRESCHECLYASTYRQSDITLADFWGYSAHSFKTRNYNRGTSLILVNSENGQKVIESIKNNIFIEEISLEKAKKGNKCLSESFKLDQTKLDAFWSDYNCGMNVHDLNEKYCAHTFVLPKHLWLRRLYNKYKWLIKK